MIPVTKLLLKIHPSHIRKNCLSFLPCLATIYQNEGGTCSAFEDSAILQLPRLDVL